VAIGFQGVFLFFLSPYAILAHANSNITDSGAPLSERRWPMQ
jgi:hypothetical protein